MVILGRRAYHRGPADIDILDGVGLGDIGTAGHALEWIEVNDDQINCADAVLLQDRQMLLHIPSSQYAAVNLGMQRLDTAIEDLRETGDIGYGRGRGSGVADRLECSPGRDNLDTKFIQAFRQFNKAVFILDAYQCSFDFH